MSLTDVIKKYAKLIALGVFIGLIMRMVISLCIVNGSSMYPTLNNGDIFIGLNTSLTRLERGDIVTIDMSEEGYGQDIYVKRIIGIPGDKIKVVNRNGELLEEDYVNKVYEYEASGVVEYTLKDDEYFVLGDNRGNSTDSRMFGPVKRDSIKLEYFLPLS